MNGSENAPRTGRKPADSASRGLTREERLAAKLRENLRRRKSQARALDTIGTDESPTSPPAHDSARESDGLSKTPPES